MYIHTYVYICIYICLHTHTHTHIYIRVYVQYINFRIIFFRRTDADRAPAYPARGANAPAPSSPLCRLATSGRHDSTEVMP